MTRIVVDLTEFNTWSGHLTGIQRVSHGMAKSFSKDTAFFIAFNGRDAFYEVDYDEFMSYFEESNPTEGKTTQQITVNKNNYQHHVKTFAKKIYYRMPGGLRQKFTPERRDKIKRFSQKFYHKLSRTGVNSKSAIVKFKSDAPFVFKSSDVILSSCRAWDHDEYLSKLHELKSRYGVKLAFVIYDLIPIYQQHTFGPGLTERYSKYLYKLLKISDYLLPISASSKKDLLKYADEIGIIDMPDIETIRLGDDITEQTPGAVPSFVKNVDSFTLSVGTIEARKNHAELYYAYKLAVEKGITLPDLYIIGKPGWLTGDILYAIDNDSDISEKITIIQNVTDQELAWLYKNALFTVYPSQYEGWGLPIAESLAYGTPCIASSTSSMIEIAPEYVDHVSPFNPAELLNKMEYYSNTKNSDKKRKEIEAGYKTYSWSATKNRIREIIE